MKNILFLIFCLLASQLFAQEDLQQEINFSTKTLNVSNTQELFNSLKRVFFLAEHENILDTNWTALHISKRVTTGFVNIDVDTQNVVLSVKAFKDTDEKELRIEIYTTRNDEVTHYESDSFLHRLFWNRIEYILGLEDEWIVCHNMAGAIGNSSHLLCNANEEKAILEVKQEQ